MASASSLHQTSACFPGEGIDWESEGQTNLLAEVFAKSYLSVGWSWPYVPWKLPRPWKRGESRPNKISCSFQRDRVCRGLLQAGCASRVRQPISLWFCHVGRFLPFQAAAKAAPSAQDLPYESDV